nr:MAG TPA: hypothetical protein [Bacteriophage sp.]
MKYYLKIYSFIFLKNKLIAISLYWLEDRGSNIII